MRIQAIDMEPIQQTLHPFPQPCAGPQHGRDVLGHVPAEQGREPDDDEDGYGREEEFCVVEEREG